MVQPWMCSTKDRPSVTMSQRKAKHCSVVGRGVKSVPAQSRWGTSFQGKEREEKKLGD